MFTVKGILQLHRWTHNSLDGLFKHCATMPFELLTQELAGFGFPSIRRQLVHCVHCESYWVWKLQHPDEAEGPDEEWQSVHFGGLGLIEAKRAAVRAETIRYVDTLQDSELDRELVLSWPGEGSETGSRAFYLQHMLTHHFHHKGQVVAMCRLLGHPAPETDLLWAPPEA